MALLKFAAIENEIDVESQEENMEKSQLQLTLRAMIKEHADAGRRIRREKSSLRCSFVHGRGGNSLYMTEMSRLCDERELTRRKARATLLAYGYVRGRTYTSIEANTRLSGWAMRDLIANVAVEAQVDPADVSAWMTHQRSSEAA